MHMRYFGATLSKCTEYFLLRTAIVDQLATEPAKFTRALPGAIRTSSALRGKKRIRKDSTVRIVWTLEQTSLGA